MVRESLVLGVDDLWVLNHLPEEPYTRLPEVDVDEWSVMRDALVERAPGRKEEWRDGALCAQVDADIFFPEKGGSTREAKWVCRMCDVRVECLAYALENDERFGIWGGKSERERRKLKR